MKSKYLMRGVAVVICILIAACVPVYAEGETGHVHSYGDTYMHDESAHWKECSCGAQTERASHTWNQGTIVTPSTETSEGKVTYTCLVCGQTLDVVLPKIPHTHNFGTSYRYDETYHWMECSCGEKTNQGEHQWNEGTVSVPATEESEGVMTYTCTICGKAKATIIGKLAHTHQYSETYSYDDDSHWKECSCGEKISVGAHTWDEGKVTVAATETSEGEILYTCTVCGKTKTETVPKLSHAHDFGTGYKYNEELHWKECSCGVKTEEGSHVFGEGVVTVPATDTAEGVKTYTCSVCGKTKAEIIPKLSHQHDFGTTYFMDENNHWLQCSCGEKSMESSHVYGEGTVIRAATEENEGEMSYTCTVCGYVKTAAIPKASHVHVFGTEYKTTDTLHWVECACGEKSLLGEHVLDEGVVVIEPTTENDGAIVYTCTVCGEKIIKTLPYTGHVHDFSGDYKYNETSHWLECSCGEREDEENHSYNKGVLIKPATETEKGKILYTCSVCGYENTVDIPMIEHVHDFGTVYKKDTQTHWLECSCGEKMNYGAHELAAKIIREATDTEPGTMSYECSVCGFVFFESIPVKEHVHFENVTMNYDAEEHWKVCSCGEIGEKEPHSFVWVLDGTKVTGACACGYVASSNEDYSGLLQLSGIGNASGNGETAVISPEVLELQNGKNAGIQVNLGNIRIAYDAGAVRSILSYSADNDIVVSGEIMTDISGLSSIQKASYEKLKTEGSALICVEIASGDSLIHNFGDGKALVTVDFEKPAAWSADKIAVYRLESDGTKTQVSSSYSEYERTVSFRTDSHSFYIITQYEEESSTSRGMSTADVVIIILGILAVAAVGVVVCKYVFKDKKHSLR